MSDIISYHYHYHVTGCSILQQCTFVHGLIFCEPKERRAVFKIVPAFCRDIAVYLLIFTTTPHNHQTGISVGMRRDCGMNVIAYFVIVLWFGFEFSRFSEWAYGWKLKWDIKDLDIDRQRRKRMIIEEIIDWLVITHCFAVWYLIKWTSSYKFFWLQKRTTNKQIKHISTVLTVLYFYQIATMVELSGRS